MLDFLGSDDADLSKVLSSGFHFQHICSNHSSKMLKIRAWDRWADKSVAGMSYNYIQYFSRQLKIFGRLIVVEKLELVD